MSWNWRKSYCFSGLQDHDPSRSAENAHNAPTLESLLAAKTLAPTGSHGPVAIAYWMLLAAEVARKIERTSNVIIVTTEGR